MFCTPLYAMVPRNQAYWGSGCPHVSELRRVAPEGGPPSMCHSFPQSVIVALNVSELGGAWTQEANKQEGSSRYSSKSPSMCHSFPQSVIVPLNVSELAAKNRSRMGLAGVPKVTLKELLNKHYYKTSFLTL